MLARRVDRSLGNDGLREMGLKVMARRCDYPADSQPASQPAAVGQRDGLQKNKGNRSKTKKKIHEIKKT